jgi:phage terminase Nu1 subunit (DNA packaging protein)
MKQKPSKPQRKPRKAQRSAPVKKAARKLGVSRRHYRRLKAKGIAPDQMAAERAANGRFRDGPPDALAGIANERHRLLIAQADNEEIDRDRNRGRLVEVERVLNALEKAESMKVARERAAFVVSLPAKLGGQPADKIAAAYEKELNEIHADYVKQFKVLAGV